MSGRLAGVAVLVGLLAGLFVWFLSNPGVIPPLDFVEYWSAGRLMLDGGNPYNAAQLLPLQRWAANEPERTHAVMMWNPPWALPLYVPFAWLDPRPAHVAWEFLQLALILGCSLWLWHTYGGPRRYVPAVTLIALSFYGTIWTLGYGQNTGWLLLGLAGFAGFTKADRPALAGAFAALTALKPHLLAVFGVLLILNAFRPRGWKTLLAGVGVLALGLLIALALNPDILSQYAWATRAADDSTRPLSGWKLPLASFYLRFALAKEHFWVQFVPCAVACVGYAIHFWRRRHAWDWPAQLPMVVGVSVLTAPYGGWIFDLVVLLVPVMQAAAWLATSASPATRGLFAAAHLGLTWASFALAVSLHHFWWVAPATLALYLAAYASTRNSRLSVK